MTFEFSYTDKWGRKQGAYYSVPSCNPAVWAPLVDNAYKYQHKRDFNFLHHSVALTEQYVSS
jgi:hypothetical protein